MPEQDKKDGRQGKADKGTHARAGAAVRRARRGLVLLAPALLALAALPAPVLAAGADFPGHPVRLVVPFPPGGPTDLVSRIIARKMSEELGQQVLVDNRPGANGNIAAELVAKAPADGYTVLYNTSSIALSPALYKKLSYDVRRDFAPVAMTAMVPLVLEVNAQVPASSLAEFIRYLKANPGKLTYGSAGNGNVTHLAAFLFLQANGLSAVHVPYKGSAPALTDLAGGQVQFMADTINSSLPFIRDKRMKALAVTSSTRSSQLPDVPTVAETAIPGFDVGAWQGMLVPARTSPDIVHRLNAATQKALASPDVRASLAAQGAEPRGSSPEAYGRYLAQEIERWHKVVKDSGVTLD
ncbi:tripartite tricarboxylate transporter substrate binding protein [Cupriavidus basilensis]|uniref:Tripartite tricarboxylate transporter substrate binding protein n=1 Tax=Cupriavidus basilensis TaxID=68895 RepID=A0ABT6AYA3_9BURK|nr:tripartite tricarboxylate transporter substrate binding protein [Cupriavidus basilensis]MDF3837237.1 tripartite tricarboxylate transporter substrate binding protein [Cupriavidus basilensis]